MLYLFVILFFSTILSEDLVVIDGVVKTDVDFFQKYNKQDWAQSSDQQKTQMLNDYIKRVVVEKEALSVGFLFKPEVAIKIKNRADMIMVNAVYEELVAKPLVDSLDFELALSNINKEVLVSHILIGYSGSRLQKPPKRTKDNAFLLAQKIQKELLHGVGGFDSVAKKYSDDPSVVNNGGSLGWLGWGRTVPSFQRAAFQLKKHDISQPILTDFGYHIILLEDVRGVGLGDLSREQLEYLAYNSCKGLIQNKLQPAAALFDSMQMVNVGLVFNEIALDEIVQNIKKEEGRLKLANKYNLDLVDLLLKMDGVGVVCVYNGAALGVKWFAEHFKKIPFSRRPRLRDTASVVSAFKTALLQNNAVYLGEKKGVQNTYYYKKLFEDMQSSLLYDVFFKWVVNNAKKPDSLQVKQYYEKHKLLKYKKPEQVVVREIRVMEKELADSLLLELKYGVDFTSLASQFSKSNPHKGGLIQSFERGKYNNMGATAFSMDVGQFSKVIENLDNSFSIIKVEGFVGESVSPLGRVFVRIETLLTREFQDSAKVGVVSDLFEKYGVDVLWLAGDQGDFR